MGRGGTFFTSLFHAKLVLDDGRRCLRHTLPEFAIVAEKYPGARRFELGELVERSHHRIAVMDISWQAAFAQSPAEVARIGGKDDISRGEPYFQRLVPRGVAVRRQAYEASIA